MSTSLQWNNSIVSQEGMGTHALTWFITFAYQKLPNIYALFYVLQGYVCLASHGVAELVE